MLEEEMRAHDLPIDVPLKSESWPDAHLRVRLPKHKRLNIKDLRSRHRGRYVAIHGQIARVTQQTERITHAHWECANYNCPEEYYIPQPRGRLKEPQYCSGSCSGKPTFELNERKSDTVDMRKLKLKQPPENASGNGDALTVYLEDDLAFLGGDKTLPDMSGERATIHGVLRRDDTDIHGRNGKPIFDSYLNGHHIEFERSVAENVETSEHADEIQTLAEREDTLEYAIANFAPGVQGGQRIQQIKRGIVLYLFGGYRKESDGKALRGDIHILMIGDPATGKTSLLNWVEEVSPRSERLSGSASTGVGLTAAAKQDEFAGGDWVLEPGLLPRASGGHAIIDEIDDLDGNENLNEALETQRVHVSKAGMNATLKTEVGLIAAGNPEEGRFDYDEFIQQIDVDPALFTRFDIVHTLIDEQDEDIDSAVAEAALDDWKHATDNGSKGDISTDVWRAWIATAKELQPEMTEAGINQIREFYTDERGNADDDSTAITARALHSVARLAEAHARLNLRETVTTQDATVAINVKRAVMGDVYRQGADIDVDHVTGVKTQKQRREGIIRTLRSDGELAFDELQDTLNLSENVLENDLNKLKRKGVITEPRTGTYRAV
jgi:replicative DNA helicase Mcm